MFTISNIDKSKEQLITDLAELQKRAIELETSQAQHKLTENQLQEKAAQLRAILETFDGQIYVVSQDYRIEYMNRNLIRRTGYDATGELCYKVVHGRDSICPWCFKDRVFNGEIIRAELQSPKDRRWYSFIRTPIYHVDGTISMNVIMQNVTDLKVAEEERQQREEELKLLNQSLIRSNIELEQLAYVASHDLREPLRMVASYVQLLERRYKGKLDSDADDFIAFAVDGAKRMQLLIDDLLTYSRIGTHGQPFKSTNCEHVLSRTLFDLKFAIEDSKAIITHDHLPTIMADELQLKQLFQNLISNAIKFRGPNSPHVHISAAQMENEWVFSVSDNGIGIAPEYFERIFVIFQRLHGNTEYQGTGIGLAVSQKVVERHGGRIWVESAPGKGARFSFTIPMKGCQRK